MLTNRFWRITSLLVVAAMVLSACAGGTTTPAAQPTQAAQPTAEPTQAPSTGFTIPDIAQGKFNVAIVLIGFHADGGWSQAHTEGAQWLPTQDPCAVGARARRGYRPPANAEWARVRAAVRLRGLSFVVETGTAETAG